MDHPMHGGNRRCVDPQCPGRGHVVDSRRAPLAGVIGQRRRVVCQLCGKRWWTLEVVDTQLRAITERTA